MGCCISCKAFERPIWIPAYYNKSAEARHESDGTLLEATGAGNAFLGGYAIGLKETGDIIQACCFSAVVASFAVEHIGLPERVITEDGYKIWNKADVRDRLERFTSMAGFKRRAKSITD